MTYVIYVQHIWTWDCDPFIHLLCVNDCWFLFLVFGWFPATPKLVGCITKKNTYHLTLYCLIHGSWNHQSDYVLPECLKGTNKNSLERGDPIVFYRCSLNQLWKIIETDPMVSVYPVWPLACWSLFHHGGHQTPSL